MMSIWGLKPLAKRTIIPGMEDAVPHTDSLETSVLSIRLVFHQNYLTETCFMSTNKLCFAIRQ